jgi:hypothetical protein
MERKSGKVEKWEKKGQRRVRGTWDVARSRSAGVQPLFFVSVLPCCFYTSIRYSSPYSC